MSINKADILVQDRLVQEVANLRSDLDALKTKQSISGDAILYDAFPQPAVEVSFTLPNNGVQNQFINVTNVSNQMIAYDLVFSVYADVDANANNLLPSGSSVNSFSGNLRTEVYKDLASSNLATGLVVYVCRFYNFTGSSHNIYFYFQVVSPKIGGA